MVESRTGERGGEMGRIEGSKGFVVRAKDKLRDKD